MNRRLLEIILVFLMAVVIGIFTINLTSSDPDIDTIFDIKFILTLFNMKNMKEVVFLIIVLFILYFRIYGMPSVRISTMQEITNTLVYLHAFTLFLPWSDTVVPFLPHGARITVFLFSLLFVTAIISAFSQKAGQNRISRAFKILSFWLIFSTIAGLVSGIINIDPVRAKIPLKLQLTSPIKFADALLVYYVIVRNNWGYSEFERLFRIVLWCGFIISLESLTAVYGGFYFSKFSISPEGKFTSMFIGSHYYPGIIGMSMIFLSVYFLTRYRKRVYLILIILGFLLAFSSLARNIVYSLILGMLLFIFLAIKYSGKSIQRDYLLKTSFVFLGIIIIPILLFFITIYLYILRPDTIEIDSLLGRGYLYLRVLDVFFHYPVFGTGLGLGFYYTHSDTVSPVFTEHLPYSISVYSFYQRGKIYSGSFSDIEEVANTLHNLTLDFALGLGLVGLLFVIYLLYQGVKIFKFIISLAKRTKGKYRWVPIFAICSLILSISLAMQTTSKFQSYWYLAILYGFLNFIYKTVLVWKKESLNLTRNL